MRATILTGSFLLFASLHWVAAAEPTSAPGPAAAAKADDLPRFQPGLWEYRRTVLKSGAGTPEVSTFQKCSDPSTEFRQKMAELEKKGCRFSPAQRTQQGYISQWICPTPAGPMKFRDVLISQGATTYQSVSEAHGNEQVIRSTIDAVRLSECTNIGPVRLPKAQRAAPPAFLKQSPRQ